MAVRGVVAAAVGATLVAVLVLGAAARRPPLDLDVVDLLALEVAALLAAVGAILLATALRRSVAVARPSNSLGWPTVAVLVGGLALAVLSAGLTLGGVEPPAAVGERGGGGGGPGSGTGDALAERVLGSTGWSPWVAVVLLAVAATAVLLGRAWLTSPHRATAAHRRGEVDIEAAVEAARRAVATGTSGDRAAVLAAFAALESALAEEGVPRLATETQDELVLRVLAARAAPAASLDSLARAYRTARWSRARVDPTMREEAEQALEDVLASLGGGS